MSRSDSWQHDLAEAYRWAFHTQPCLTYTPRAGELLDVVREAEDMWDTTPPEKHGGFLLRVGDHVSRMAGTLAAAEHTAIHSTHSGPTFDRSPSHSTFALVRAMQAVCHQQTKNVLVAYSPKQLGFFQSLKSVAWRHRYAPGDPTW